MFFAGTNSPAPSLYLSSGWEPPWPKRNQALDDRIARFTSVVKNLNPKRRGQSNLTPGQRSALYYLRNTDELIVWSCDKNLGPAIIERDAYIRRVFNDHLLDRKTYRQLTEDECRVAVNLAEISSRHFFENFNKNDPDFKYLRAYKDEVKDPVSYFYILAKVHKSPLSSRPIVSTSGSLLYGVGRWLDVELQSIVRNHVEYVTKSSYEHRRELESLGSLPPNAKLFTMDAQAFYTNIDTRHALAEIGLFLLEVKIERKRRNMIMEA